MAFKKHQNSSNSEPFLEKMVYNDQGDVRREALGSDVEEFTTNSNYLGDNSGLMGQKSLQKEKCLSLDRINFETNLEEKECQYCDLCSLEGDLVYAEDEDVRKSHLKSVALSRKAKEMNSTGNGHKINPVNSGQKGKLNKASRRKNDAKYLTTKQGNFGNPSASVSSVNISDATRSGIDVEPQDNESNAVLFLKLENIGKLSFSERSNIFDLPNENGLSLNCCSSSSPENLENKAKRNDAFQNQYSSFPSINNQPKNVKCEGSLQVPELHIDEVTDTESFINRKQENKTRKNDELIRLSVPKEIHKSESGRLKVKSKMTGKMKESPITRAERQVAEDGMMPETELQVTQNDESTFNHWKTQGNSETEVKANMIIRSSTSKTDLVRQAVKDHLSPSVLDEVDTSINTLEQFERQNLEDRKDVKKQFRLKIAETKKTLLEAKLNAQEKTASKRFNQALKKHTEVKLKRAFMKADSLCKSSATPTLNSRGPSSVVAVRKNLKDVSMQSVLSEGVSNVQEIRKVEADFDRAKVKQTKIKLQKKKSLLKISINPPVKKLQSVKNKKDRERLERYEVEKMISELRSLDMIEYADKLSQAMASKDEYETKLRHELNQERKLAAQLAKKQKSEKLARIRKEEKKKKMAEKEKLEQERKEREALETAKRQAEAIKRRDDNLKLQESIKYTLLATDMSRSYTYSYLPKLEKVSSPKNVKNDRDRLKKVKARYMQGI